VELVQAQPGGFGAQGDELFLSGEDGGVELALGWGKGA